MPVLTRWIGRLSELYQEDQIVNYKYLFHIILIVICFYVNSPPILAQEIISNESSEVGTDIIDWSDGWQFIKDNQDMGVVNLPHTCSVGDGLSEDYFKGITKYKKHLNVEKGKTYILMFEAVGQTASVYIDGQLVRVHKGGYTPFVISICENEVGTKEIQVVCDNHADETRAPTVEYFNLYNGIYRRVWLMETDTAHFLWDTYGMDRFHVVQNDVSASCARFTVKTELEIKEEKKIELVVRLFDADGDVVLSDSESFKDKYGKISFSNEYVLESPHLWQGKIDPYLYTLTLELYDGSKLIDTAYTKIGFRWFTIDDDNNFYLNGNLYDLYGVNLHQDSPNAMIAVTDEDIRNDYFIVNESGATMVRLVHYPHNAYSYDICDRLGIIVQTEIPWIQNCNYSDGELFYSNLDNQLKELINNFYNHPSIIFWGLSNEVGGGKYDFEKSIRWHKRLCDTARELDKTRLVGAAITSNTLVNKWENLNRFSFLDYVGINIYYGWYTTEDSFFTIKEKVTETITRLQKYEDIPAIAITEYGCGNNPFQHSADAFLSKETGGSGEWHSEEYANEFHEAYWDSIENNNILFSTVWSMFDFYHTGRNEGGVPYQNDKGLVTRDRKTYKDIFYLYQSVWREDAPVVHIASKRFLYRTAKETGIKIYANVDTLKLYIDGIEVESLVSSNEGNIWAFKPVNFSAGRHTITAVGEKNGVIQEDSTEWTFLDVISQLKVTEQPQNQSVYIYQPAKNRINIEGGELPYKFRWQFSNLNTAEWIDVDNNDAFVVENNEIVILTGHNRLKEDFRLRCIVEDNLGECVVSDSTVITIYGGKLFTRKGFLHIFFVTSFIIVVGLVTVIVKIRRNK